MKTQFENVYFTVVDSDRKLQEWNCYDKKDNRHIGQLEFFYQGKQYYYLPCNECYFSENHFKDILDFITQLNNQ